MSDDKKKDDKTDGSEDARLEFLLNYLTKSYKLKQEKWNKMIATDEYRKLVMKFLDDPDQKFLLLTIPSTGLLTPFTSFNAQLKQKFTYFVKKKAEAVTMENFRTVLMFGDMSGKPIDDLAVLVEGVFVPLLSNPANQTGWPRVVAQDVVAHVRTFKNTVDQIKGAMKSQVILPMPQGLSSVYQAVQIFIDTDGEEVNLPLKTTIENAVMKWTGVCGEVLKQTSQLCFANGVHPVPHNEIDFWNARVKNMESIYDQMCDPRVKKMSEYLQLTNSTYSKAYKTLFKDIVAALVEARDVSKYLKPLIPHFSKFEENDFLETDQYVNSMLHVVGLVWSNSKYYARSDRIVILFKMIVNLLIESAERALDPGSIFQGEPDEMHEKIDGAIKVLDKFEEAFEYVRVNLEGYYREPASSTDDIPVRKPWNFHRRNVFQRLIDFRQRLHLVKSILQTFIDFSRLEKVEIGGIKGRYLSAKCSEIFEAFNKSYALFQNLQYDVLNTQDDSLVKDFEQFQEVCADYDKKLAAIFTQAFDDCYNLETLFKYLNIAGNMFTRPYISKLVREKYSTITKMFDDELNTVKDLYDTSKIEGAPIDKYYPPLAGTILWLQRLYWRVAKPAEDFILIEDEILSEEDTKFAFEKLDELLNLLMTEQNRLLQEWFAKIPDQIRKSMAKFQVVRTSTDLLQLNFDMELEAILREIKYLKGMNIENLPEQANELFGKAEELFQAILKFKRIVEWYNYLKKRTSEVEYNLVRHEVEAIDIMLNKVIDNCTWESSDPDIIEQIFISVKELTDRVKRTQANISNLFAGMNVWANQLLFERKDGKKENLLYLEDRIERLQKRQEQVVASSEELQRIIKENFQLFFKEPLEPEAPVGSMVEDEELSQTPEEPTAAETKKGKKKKK